MEERPLAVWRALAVLVPDPFGPTTQVAPSSKAKVVGCANDVKPVSVTLLRCTRPPFLARQPSYTLPTVVVWSAAHSSGADWMTHD